MLEGRRISYEDDGAPTDCPPKAGETRTRRRTLMMGIRETHSKSEQQTQPDEKSPEKQQIDVETLRKRSRQEYLMMREKKKLEQLINDVEDQEYLFQGVDLTSEQRLKRQICDLVGKKIDCSKEYRIPESYDGNRRKGFDAALQRYTDPDPDPAWEEHQFGKAIMKHQKKNCDYEFVFEHQIDSVKTELIDSGDRIEEESPLPELENEKKNLPIYAYKEQLMKAVDDHQVLVIVGETGSGKTIQIPQFLDEAGYTRRGMIGCTQPRRVAAMSVAARVAREKGVKLGNEVGYSIRFEDRTSQKTVLKYMTDGRLLHEFRQQLRKEPILASYSVIMVDEAHERTVNTDILFSLLKDVTRARPDFKLIISSATLDAIKFSDYFDSAPIFTIPGRKFPVEILYTRAPEPDYLAAAVATALQIHATEEAGDGDILVFLTGQEEIEAAEVIVSEKIRKVGTKMAELIICPIYANLPSEVQARVFDPTPKGARKLVLATNIAETSLTIDGIKYVVDCGFAKMKSYSPRVGMESLVVEPITRASANQRAGRSGRTGPGKCFRLYTAYTFANELDENIVPEIQRTNLGNVVLTLKSLGVDDLLHFDFMDPPPAEALVKALELLYALGALNKRGEEHEAG
ncbi:pre-mRNA-splicing factor ATP-dependent RNA helicase DEAH1-like isoform X3 [Salvia splendens]|uniref:pre-mRNA-splicing factor ATP-dependent RNA helicase DEAH1-like isoform X3 n=1 Tax=Salvia splendens TaxID=180675 RepID=UPI001C25DE79|nr:pre-mRNA-splicing factor ATP-dependent RNA helicase DEAH1-like isoform X3 [Salvia splendens]